MADLNPTPPYTCKYCGKPSWIEPSDQHQPPDYCHSIDHGAAPDRVESGEGHVGYFEEWGIWHGEGWMRDAYGHPALFSEEMAKNLCIGPEYEAKKLRVSIEVVSKNTVDRDWHDATDLPSDCFPVLAQLKQRRKNAKPLYAVVVYFRPKKGVHDGDPGWYEKFTDDDVEVVRWKYLDLT